MQVPEEMASARESRIRPCNNIPRQSVRRESARSSSRLLRCLADTQLNEITRDPVVPRYAAMWICCCCVFVVNFPVSISNVAPVSERMGK